MPVWQSSVERDVTGRPPPASAVSGDFRGCAYRETPSAQFTEDCRPLLPLFAFPMLILILSAVCSPGVTILPISLGRALDIHGACRVYHTHGMNMV
jgi:hypothetical protein